MEPGGPINNGPWTVVYVFSGSEPRGALCCTGTEADARQTATYWNLHQPPGTYEARLLADVPEHLRTRR